MSDDQKDPKESTEPTRITMGDIRKVVEDMVSKAAGALKPGDGDKGDDKATPKGDASIPEQVRAAFAHLRAKEEREKEEASLKADVAALKERTTEKPPVQRGRLHRFMGWGEPT